MTALGTETVGSYVDAAFEQLYVQHFVAVHSYVSAFVDQPDVDDVVADTFITALSKFDAIPSGLERAWLLGVARRIASTVRRSGHRAARTLDQLTSLRPTTTTDLSDGHLLVEDVDAVREAIVQLGPADQEVLVLAYWYDLTIEELAETLGLTRNATSVRLHRAKRRFATHFARLRRMEHTR